MSEPQQPPAPSTAVETSDVAPLEPPSEPQEATSATTSELPTPAVPANPGTAFKVYKPSNSAHTPKPPPPLSDDYFTPTTSDIKAAQSQLTSRSQALIDAPLQLKAAREAVEQAKRDRWPNTTIRIRFPDRTQVEKVFPSTDKIKSVYAFIRGTLRDDVKPIKFILSEPPRRELKVSDPQVRDLSLVRLQLVPSAILILRFVEEHLNASSSPAPLLPEILAQAVDLPAPPPTEDRPAAGSTNSTQSKAMAAAVASKSEIEKKMSKWFKGLTKK